MRNLLDTTSIAQSLDGERLMGSLPFPNKRYSFIEPTTRTESHDETRQLGIFLSPHSLHYSDDLTRVGVDDSHQFFNGE